MLQTNKWAPILETLGVSKEHKRFNELCEYAEIQKNLFKSTSVNENVNYANYANSKGFGNVVAPGINATPGLHGTQGSGDIAQVLLPASVKIAAHTPGLNLLPTINVNSNVVHAIYHDWKYEDYATFDSADQQERGSTFKLDMSDTNIAALKTAVTGAGVKIMRGILDKPVFLTLTNTAISTPATITDIHVAPATNKLGVVQFLGFSKIDGMPMFRIFTQDNTASTGNWSFNQALNTLPNDALSIADHFSLAQGAILTIAGTQITIDNPTQRAYEVSLNEDVVKDFSTKRGSNTGMNRNEWDASTAGKIGMETFTKTFQIGVRHISATLRLSEMDDYQRMYGINIVDKTREKLVEQLQQEISIEIVEKVKELGERNRAQLIALHGKSMYDMDASVYTSAGLYESSFSLTRKLWQKVIGGSFWIKSDGKHGLADYAVVSSGMIPLLREMNGYQNLPINALNINLGKSIEAVGSIDGITLYVDPQMMPGDMTIYLGRVGTKEDPGLKFFAYMLAQDVQIVSENTMAPHLYLYSRYAINEFGFFPEKQYLAIHVHDAGQDAEILW